MTDVDPVRVDSWKAIDRVFRQFCADTLNVMETAPDGQKMHCVVAIETAHALLRRLAAEFSQDPLDVDEAEAAVMAVIAIHEDQEESRD